MGQSAGAVQRASDAPSPRPERVRGGELVGRGDERSPGEPLLAIDGGRHGLGRLRRLLRPRRPAAVRHHGARGTVAGPHHVAVDPAWLQPEGRLDRPSHVRVLIRVAVHRGDLRARSAHETRRAGRPPDRRVRLLEATRHAQADPAPPAGLSVRQAPAVHRA